jgi:hypothetical protein
MGSILLKVSIIALLIGFLAFLAWDDYRSRKAREAEEKREALTGPDRRDGGRGEPPAD